MLGMLGLTLLCHREPTVFHVISPRKCALHRVARVVPHFAAEEPHSWPIAKAVPNIARRPVRINRVATIRHTCTILKREAPMYSWCFSSFLLRSRDALSAKLCFSWHSRSLCPRKNGDGQQRSRQTTTTSSQCRLQRDSAIILPPVHCELRQKFPLWSIAMTAHI